MPTREERAASLPGLTPPETLNLLRLFAREIPKDEAIVEIGVFKGKSAAYLGLGAFEGFGAHVWAVDPWDLPGERTSTSSGPNVPIDYTDPAIRESAAAALKHVRVSPRVTLVQDFSTEFAARWTGPKVGMLFVDGDHRQAHVRQDFAAWEPHLAPGALVLFDDYSPTRYPGVVAVVDHLVDKGVVENLTVSGTLAMTQRPS